MSSVTAETAQAQEAFVGLLTRPLVTAASDPSLHRLVRRHQRTLSQWAGRCGYRLVAVGDATRLHRVPLGGRVEHPTPHPPPSRRLLVLALAAAAACEEGETTTTVQAIADGVRALTGLPESPVTGFDPQKRAERIVLVRALELLERYGVLRRRTFNEEMLRSWEDTHQGVGRGYEVDRAALLQLVDPAVVAAAFTDHDEIGKAAVSQHVLRILLETQAVLYADLTDDEREWLRTRRARVVDDAVRMTGGIVEIRAEGLLLILPPTTAATSDATVPWPRANTPSWVALLLVDAAIATARDHVDEDGVLCVPSDEVDLLAGLLHEERRNQLTRELREDAARLRPLAETTLIDAGLLDVVDGDWRLLPTAARYREPLILVGGTAEDDE